VKAGLSWSVFCGRRLGRSVPVLVSNCFRPFQLPGAVRRGWKWSRRFRRGFVRPPEAPGGKSAAEGGGVGHAAGEKKTRWKLFERGEGGWVCRRVRHRNQLIFAGIRNGYTTAAHFRPGRREAIQVPLRLSYPDGPACHLPGGRFASGPDLFSAPKADGQAAANPVGAWLFFVCCFCFVAGYRHPIRENWWEGSVAAGMGRRHRLSGRQIGVLSHVRVRTGRQ